MNDFKQLEESIAKKGNRPIFFIGSGLTRRYLNGPDWRSLLNLLIEKKNLEKELNYYLQKNNGDYELIASELENEYFEIAWNLKEEYHSKFYTEKYEKSIYLKLEIAKIFIDLEKRFEYKNHSKEVDLLKQTNPTLVITTNYDEFLEKNIFTDFKTIVGQNIISDKTKGKNGKILKIHGCVKKPESIIITKSDYEYFIKNQKYLSAKLLAYFVEYPVIIMGYSLSDRNILGILEVISEISLYGESNKKSLENIWFINFTKKNFDEINVAQEKEILLPNNKILKINFINVMTFVNVYESIIETNKYPYSLTSVANELGFNHWKQIEKLIKTLERESNLKIKESKKYYKRYGNEDRYNEEFVISLREIMKHNA